MTQPEPQRKPEQPKPPHEPAKDPFDQIWVNMPLPRSEVLSSRPEIPHLQTSPKRYGPLDRLASQLSELGLQVERNAYAQGTTWQIVAKEPSQPHREVRINLGPQAMSLRTNNLLVMHVRLHGLVRDCETARVRATIFMKGTDTDDNHSG
jgi:hypothetical protein